MSSEDEVLYLEGNAPETWGEWTQTVVNSVAMWTYEWGNGIATVLGLDEATFQQLSFVAGLPEGFFLEPSGNHQT